MKDPNPFFRWLYRLLAVGGLCLLLVIVYVLVSSELAIRRSQSRDTVLVQKTTSDGRKKEEELRFGGLEAIRGSSTRLIKVESQTERGVLRGSSGGTGGTFARAIWCFCRPVVTERDGCSRTTISTWADLTSSACATTA